MTRRSTALNVHNARYAMHSLQALEGEHEVRRLPYCLKILLENLLRHEDGVNVTKDDIAALADWDPKAKPSKEIAFTPARVLMQDFTGVPAVVDLAAMRDAMQSLGGDPNRINPLSPAELVIDHSVMVDVFGTADAALRNAALEFQRNRERYEFLRWGQQAFSNFKVVPAGHWHRASGQSGIPCEDGLHQKDKRRHGGVSRHGGGHGFPHHHDQWVGRAWLGRGRHRGGSGHVGPAHHHVDPRGGRLQTDGRVARRRHGHGPGSDCGANAQGKKVWLASLLNSMGKAWPSCRWRTGPPSPTWRRNTARPVGYFPIDSETLNYLRLTGRADAQVALVEAYAKAQGMWRDADAPEADYSDAMTLDMGAVVPSLAGPKRPQDRIPLADAKSCFRRHLAEATKNRKGGGVARVEPHQGAEGQDGDYALKDGAVVIAAITSCTNTSNPSVMIGAGLAAKKARERGLKTKPWVKTSLAPGSLVARDYLDRAGLTAPLNELGFNVVGYGCTTCIGNSGPLPEAISRAVAEGDLIAASRVVRQQEF